MDKRAFYQVDPLARWIKDRWGWTPAKFAVVWTAVVLILAFSSSVVGGAILSVDGKIGFLQDWVSWIWNLFFTPILMGFYVWSADVLAGLIQELRQSDVVDIPDSDVAWAIAVYQRPWRKWVSILFAMAAGGVYFWSVAYFPSYAAAGLMPRVTATFINVVNAYAFCGLLLACIINGWILWRILRQKEFRINPLHPDRCGGLKAMSVYSLQTVYIVAMFGMVIGLSAFRAILFEPPPLAQIVIPSIPLYLVVALMSFFVPLSAAHAGMKDAKRKLLDDIAQQFRQEFSHLHQELGAENRDLGPAVSRVQQLKTLYQMTSQFPVWPYDVATLRRFTATIISPLLPALIGLVVEFLKRILL